MTLVLSPQAGLRRPATSRGKRREMETERVRARVKGEHLYRICARKAYFKVDTEPYY